jgi:predicted metal-dependent peptidase
MDLAGATKNLIIRDPFYGHFALGVEKNFSERVPTAGCTLDGINTAILFNPKFWAELTDKQKIGLMQHELAHIVMFHIINYKNYPSMALFNIAADICINQHIAPDHLPPEALLPNSFPEIKLPAFLDAHEYYKLLEDQKDKSEGLKNLLDALEQGQQVVCSHETWKEIMEKGGHIEELVRAQIEHQIKDNYENHLNKDPGKLPGHLRGFVIGLYDKHEKVTDWRQVIRSFKSFCEKQKIRFTWNRENARFPDNKAITLERKQKMLVGIDTSGSISNYDLETFFGQIQHIHKCGTEVEIIEWDYGIQRTYSYSKNMNAKNKDVKGGGGTDPTEVVEFFNKNPNYYGLIMFTDGYIGGQWLKSSKPILWIITKGGSADFQFSGKKFIIQKETHA